MKGGLRQWIRFDKNGETTIIQVRQRYRVAQALCSVINGF